MSSLPHLRLRPLSAAPIAALALIAVLASAAPAPPAVRTEIDALLARLQGSGCEFNRNGDWHTGTEVRAHLLRKLSYLEAHGGVASTELFIEKAASSSSFSGKPYLLRCGANAPVQSAQWLSAELQALRSVQALPASSPR